MLKKNKHKYITVVVLLLVFHVSISVGSTISPGQTSPGIQSQHDNAVRDNYKLESEIDRANEIMRVRISSPQRPVLDLDSQSDVKVMEVKRFVFEPVSKILSVSELEAIVKPYQGKLISVRDIYLILQQIDQLYDKSSYVARAVLPAQEVQEGIVKIQLIEAKVGDVNFICGEQKRIRDLDETFLYKSLGIKKGEPVQIKRFEKMLQRYNMMNNSMLRMHLQPGLDYGLTDLELDVTLPKPYRFSVYMDNAGRESTGLHRLGANASLWNLTGVGDSLFANGNYTEDGGSVSSYLQYIYPLIAEFGTQLTFSYEDNDYKFVDGPFTEFDINGDSRSYSVGLIQPICTENNWMLSAIVDAKNYKSSSENIFNTATTQEFWTTSPGLSFVYYGEDTTVLASASANIGRCQSYNSQDDLFDKNSITYKQSLSLVHKFDPEWYFVGSFSAQQTPTGRIPYYQQYVVGGIASVRGYSESILAGEEGLVTRLELNRILLQQSETQKKSLTAFAFYDYGQALPADAYLGGGRISSVGCGLMLGHSDWLTSRIALGLPLKDTVLEPDDSDYRLHFTVRVNF